MSFDREQPGESLEQGEGQQLEFKSRIRDPSHLASIIAGFANADGGVIVVGVREPSQVVGCDPRQLRPTYEAALSRLDPQPEAELEFVTADGKQLGVIKVQPSVVLVLSEGGAFVRREERNVPMSASEIAQLYARKPGVSTQDIEMLAAAIANQTGTIQELQQALERANSLSSRAVEWAVSGIIGAILGQLLALLIG